MEQRNYVICQQGAGLFGFIHRTVLEYLCAAQILWRIGKSRDLSLSEACKVYVLPHCEDDSWREVILLLAAQLQPRDAVTLVESLLCHPIKRWNPHDDAAPSLELAIGCLGERRRRDQRHFEVLKRKIIEYASDDRDPHVRATAIDGLGQHFLSDPEIRLLLIEWAANDALPFGLNHAAEALAHLASDRETRALLMERVKHDDAGMRRAAIRALREQVASDPEIRALLIDRAIKDEDAGVSQAAILALARHAASDPGLRAVLMARAKDDDAKVRRTAISALGAHVASDRETRALLIEGAKDDDAGVRQAAIDGLGQLASAPEIRALLIERAREDQLQVSRAAIWELVV